MLYPRPHLSTEWPKNGKNGKSTTMKIDPWSPPMMFTDQRKLKPPTKKDPKIANMSQKEPKNRKNVFFQKGPSEIF